MPGLLYIYKRNQWVMGKIETSWQRNLEEHCRIEEDEGSRWKVDVRGPCPCACGSHFSDGGQNAWYGRCKSKTRCLHPAQAIALRDATQRCTGSSVGAQRKILIFSTSSSPSLWDCIPQSPKGFRSSVCAQCILGLKITSYYSTNSNDNN